MTKPMPGVALRLVAGAYTLWLMAIFGAFYLAHGNDATTLQVAVAGGVIPAAIQLAAIGIDWRGLVAPTKIWLAFLVVILLSYLVNVTNPATAPSGTDVGVIPIAWSPIVYMLNAVFIMAIATLVAGCPDRRLLRAIASQYCVLAAVFLLYVDATGERVWGRLRANDIESNVWGLMGLTVCLTAFARKLGPLAIAAFASGLSMILLAQSREHLLALVIALTILFVLQLPAMKGTKLFALLLGLSALTTAAALLLDPYIFEAIRYVNTDVLLLYSRNRGLDSGFTGRTGVWAETFELWLKHPFFGVGYRQHERFLAGVPAHNAYLAVLADMGVFGLVVYLALLLSSVVAALGLREKRTRRLVVSVIASYIIIGFFDRRTIDAGNPCSLLFLMCCALALTDASLRRAGVLRAEPAPAARDGMTAIDPSLPAE